MKHQIDITDELAKRVWNELPWSDSPTVAEVKAALEAAIRPPTKSQRRWADSQREERRATQFQKNIREIDRELDEVDKLLKEAPHGARKRGVVGGERQTDTPAGGVRCTSCPDVAGCCGGHRVGDDARVGGKRFYDKHLDATRRPPNPTGIHVSNLMIEAARMIVNHNPNVTAVRRGELADRDLDDLVTRIYRNMELKRIEESRQTQEAHPGSGDWHRRHTRSTDKCPGLGAVHHRKDDPK